MKLPPDAKLVFQGKIFGVYQWQQEMYDGSFETFEMLKRADTVEVIAVSGETIYLTFQSQPNKHNFYSLLGGRVDKGEEPVAAAKRELLEESGMESDIWEEFKVYQPLHKIEWSIHTYIARNCKKVAEQKLDAGEKIEVKACTFDEFVEIVLSEKYWGTGFALDILKMKDNGTLNNFKLKLLANA